MGSVVCLQTSQAIGSGSLNVAYLSAQAQNSKVTLAVTQKMLVCLKFGTNGVGPSAPRTPESKNPHSESSRMPDVRKAPVSVEFARERWEAVIQAAGRSSTSTP